MAIIIQLYYERPWNSCRKVEEEERLGRRREKWAHVCCAQKGGRQNVTDGGIPLYSNKTVAEKLNHQLYSP